MVSRRKRSQNSINGQIVALTGKVDDQSKPTGGATVAAGDLKTNSVDQDAIAPDAVGTEQLIPGAVGTNELGIVNQVNSDSALVLNTPGKVMLTGAGYTPPASGAFSILALDSGGNVQSGPALAATPTSPGIAPLATSAEALAGTDPSKIITPATLSSVIATVQTYVGAITGITAFGGYIVTLTAGQRQTGDINATPWVASNEYAVGVQVELVSNVISGVQSWAIIAVKTSYLQRIPIPLANGWILYSDTGPDANEVYGTPKYAIGVQQLVSTTASTYAGNIYATMSRYGVVRIEGLIVKQGAAPAAGDIIAGPLPVNMRPARDKNFVVFGNGSIYAVFVTTDGYIRAGAGLVASTYLSVANIRFRAASAVTAGLATFYNLLTAASVTGFAEYTGTYYTGGSSGAGSHTPGYTLDADGVLIFEGAMVATAAYTSDAIWGRLPSSGAGSIGNYAAACNQFTYMPGIATTSLRYGTNTAAGMTGVNGLNFGAALPIGAYAVLDNASLMDPNSTTSPTVPLTGFNSNGGYGSGWRAPCMAVTPDKQVFLGGLWTGGAIGSIMTYLSTTLAPKYSNIFANLSNGAAARLDVGSPYVAGGRRNAQIGQSIGSTAWQTFDGIDYAAFDHSMG